jgi:hypothetical protein
VLPCVAIGVWLVEHEGRPVVVLTSVGDPHHGMERAIMVEAMSAEREHAVSFLAR